MREEIQKSIRILIINNFSTNITLKNLESSTFILFKNGKKKNKNINSNKKS